MEEKKKLMIIDDDVDFVKDLSRLLRTKGYQVVSVTNSKEALQAIYKEDPDLILLDIMMPGIDGWNICTKVREFSSVPIIMITAKDTVDDKVRGLEIGADDYVTKPFEFEELALRIRNWLARAEKQPYIKKETVCKIGNLKVDLAKGEVLKKGVRLKLSRRERTLLFYLIRNRGITIPHEQILSVVWGEEWKDDKQVLKSYINRVRRKIEDDPSHPRYIISERGIGYRFENVPPEPD